MNLGASAHNAPGTSSCELETPEPRVGDMRKGDVLPRWEAAPPPKLPA